MFCDENLYSDVPQGEISPSERAVYSFLCDNDIPFLRASHDEAATIDLCLSIERILSAPICKNLLLCNRTQTDFYLLMMPGDKPFKTNYLSAQINSSRLSFANGEQMEELLKTSPGSLSVLGLIFDTEKRVRLLIDRDLLDCEYIGCHPCKNTATLRIKTSDLLEKILPLTNHDPLFVSLPVE